MRTAAWVVMFMFILLMPGLTLAQEEPVTLTIFHTGDIRGQFAETGEAIGMARIASLVAATDNALLFDAGGVGLDPGAAGIMNAAGYLVMVPGLEDYAFLLLRAQAEFDIIAANLYRHGELVLQPFTIIEAAGKRIGVFGLVGGSPGGFQVADCVAASFAMVEILDGLGVDLVVCLSQLGVEGSKVVAREVEGIDVIISAGDSWSEVQWAGDALLVSVAAETRELGRIDVTFWGEGLYLSAGYLTREDLAGIKPHLGIEQLVGAAYE